MGLPSIAGYTITERLGTGGFASVYLATPDPGEDEVEVDSADHDNRVALKVLHGHSSDDHDLRRFEREATTMRAFSGHPHIVGVFESGETDDGSRYMVLEYVGGGSVRDLLKEQRALHWSEVTRIAVQICSALDVAHRSGVLHRDVKPANVLLMKDQAKLTDFGIARLVGQSQVTAAQSIIGTLAYTPPEVFHGDRFDGRGDIYQLGITMYEMLLGRAPFSSAAADNKATIIRRILDQPAPELAPFDIPEQISNLLVDVLAKDPADRPQSAESLAKRINEIEAELGRTPTPMHREQRSDTIDDIEALHAPTIAIEMDPNPTVDSVMSGDETVLSSLAESNDSVWPAAAGSSVLAGTADEAPTPPLVTPPDDVDLTVAEPRPEAATSLLAKPPEEKAPAEHGKGQEHRPAEKQPPESAPPTPVAADDPPRRRALWPLLLFALILVGGAGALFALNGLDQDDGDGTSTDGSSSTTTAPDEEEGEPETVSDPDREFAPIDDSAFTSPPGSDGVIFDSVANSQGLTIVGSGGDGESVGDQRSLVWTFGANGFAVRDFEETGPHRMWSIGVIEGETFLTVGDTEGPDGIAWTGDRFSNFAQVSNSDFAGPAGDRLRASVEDPSRDLTFLVGGSRTEGTIAVPGLWEVSGEPSWDAPTWTAIDLGSDVPGVINDIVTDGDLAVAVGTETIDGQDMAMILIRRGDVWSDLLGALPNTELWSVTIAGERVIAVGSTATNTPNPRPVAIIANSDGSVPLSHALPIRTGDGGVETGVARAVTTLDDGTVVAVGDVGRAVDPQDAGSDIDRDGAIWQLLAGDELSDDVWTTRASPDLLAEGFVELWAIDEYDDTVFVFGRTETDDGRRPAGAWTLNLG